MDDLVDRLQSLYVWPQSVADHHADVLTPRQIKKLYEVGNVAEQAIARIQALETSLAEAEGRVIAEVVAWLNNASIWLNGGECCGQKCSDGVCCAPACIWGDELKLLHSVATALETGEWKK